MRSEIHMLFRQPLNSYRLAPRPFPSCTEFHRGRRTGFRRQNLPEIIDVYVWIHTHTHTTDTFPLSPTGRFERRRRKRRGRRKKSCRTQSISVDAVFQPSSSQDQRDIPGFPEQNLTLPKIWSTSHSPPNYYADLRIVVTEQSELCWFCVMNESKHTCRCIQIT